MRLTNAMVRIISTTPIKSSMIWVLASLGARRSTKVMPMPESRNTRGRMTGSALGARTRQEMCAAINATMRPMGTARLLAVSCSPSLSTLIAKSTTTTGMAANKSSSSVFLL